MSREMGTMFRSGVPLIVSGPSGSGKTTLCRLLQAEDPSIAFSISHTTRALRGKEQEGIDYYFVNDTTFDSMIAENAFLEWAPVHNKRYGTSYAQVLSRLDAGTDVLFDIDIQGGRQIAQKLPHAVLVFVLPPSMQILEWRLRQRQSDSDDEIARRLQVAQEEIQASEIYNYFIVNQDLNQALGLLRSVLWAERLRQVDKRRLIDSMLSGDTLP